MVDDERKVSGRSLQTRGLETAKLRDPYVIVLVLGTKCWYHGCSIRRPTFTE